MKKLLFKTVSTILISGILATGFTVPAMAAEKGKDGKETKTVSTEKPSEDAIVVSEDDIKDGNMPVLVEGKDGKLSVLKEDDISTDTDGERGTVTEETTVTVMEEGGENSTDTDNPLFADGTVTEGVVDVNSEEEDPMPAYDPLTPDGNMNLVDDYGSATKHGKQFITIQSKSGAYYYIIIDRDDNGTETVHFLNQVDEADVLAHMEEEDQAAYDEWKAEIDGRNAELQAEQDALDGKPADETKTEKKDEGTGEEKGGKTSAKTSSIIIVGIFIVAGVGYLVYAKVIKGKKKTGPKEPEIEGWEDDDEEETGTETAEVPEEDTSESDSDEE